MKKQLAIIFIISFLLVGCSKNNSIQINNSNNSSQNTNSNGNISTKEENILIQEEVENEEESITNTTNSNTDNVDVVTDTSAETSEKTEPKEVYTPEIVNRDVRLFYYNPTSDEKIYCDTTVKVTDKAIVKALIKGLQNPPLSDLSPLVNQAVEVKSANLDKENNVITVDFSSNFITAHQYGSGIEAEMLQTITNTLGYNFNVTNVIIMVAGTPYQSGHIYMSYGEALTVNYSNYVSKTAN